VVQAASHKHMMPAMTIVQYLRNFPLIDQYLSCVSHTVYQRPYKMQSVWAVCTHTLFSLRQPCISWRGEEKPQAQLAEIIIARLLILQCGSALSLFHHKLDGGSHLFIDLHIHKFWDEHDGIPILGKVIFC
jgi:hypothetical protein